MADDEDDTGGFSTGFIVLIVIIVLFFLLLIIFAFVFFFRTPNNTITPVHNGNNCNCPPGPQGPQGPPGPPGGDGEFGRGLLTYSFNIITPPNGYGTIEIPFTPSVDIGNLFNFNYTASISVANGLIGGYRSIFPSNGPNSESQVRFDTEEQGGRILVHFYSGTPANLPAILVVTIFYDQFEEEIPIITNTGSTYGLRNNISYNPPAPVVRQGGRSVRNAFRRTPTRRF
jgi:hypothetical protein